MRRTKALLNMTSLPLGIWAKFALAILAASVLSFAAPLDTFASDGKEWASAADPRYSGYGENIPGSGEEYPYLIGSAAELSSMADKVNRGDASYNDKHYRLTADVDLESIIYYAGWMTLGYYEISDLTRFTRVDGTYAETPRPFSGTFDGGGHFVKNLSPERYLFGYIEGGTVKNVRVNVGGVARRVNKGSVINCHSSGPVSGGGGVVLFLGEGGRVVDCSNSGAVVYNSASPDNMAGGVVGSVEGGIVENCRNTGAIYGKENDVGGVVGRVYLGTVRNCSSAGEITGVASVGGVAGKVLGGIVENCYNAGAVNGQIWVGGVAGQVQYAHVSSRRVDARIKHCHNTGPVTGKSYGYDNSGSYGIGGVAGRVDRANLENCYSTGAVTAAGYSRDHAEWGIAVGGVGGVAGYISDESNIQGCYSAGSVFARDAGGGKVSEVGGIVGGADASTITNSFSTGGVSGGNSTGGAAGRLKKAHMYHCYSTGAVSGQLFVGGAAGRLEEGSIADCYAVGDIQGVSYVGGVAGNVKRSEINTCYSAGAVRGVSFAGGVAGLISGQSNVTDCAALNQSVSAKSSSGRVIGFADGDSFTLSDNVAFSGMKNSAGNTGWPAASRQSDKKNGADRTARDLRSESGFSKNFVLGMGWDEEPPEYVFRPWVFSRNRLPILKVKGLNGNDVLPGQEDMAFPRHLRGR